MIESKICIETFGFNNVGRVRLESTPHEDFKIDMSILGLTKPDGETVVDAKITLDAHKLYDLRDSIDAALGVLKANMSSNTKTGREARQNEAL